MPPAVGKEGTGPSTPWKFSLNVVHMKSASEQSQKLKFELKLLSTTGLCEHGGTFWIVHVPDRGNAIPLYSVQLPKQPSSTDQAKRNYLFIAQVTVDLTLGKNFRIDWSTLNRDGSVAIRDPLIYPASHVHP